MKKNFFLIPSMMVVITGLYAQRIATFTVEVPVDGMETPVSVIVDRAMLPDTGMLSLWEVSSNGRLPVPVHFDKERSELSWILRPTKSSIPMVFELGKWKSAKFNMIQTSDRDGALVIESGNKKFLSYMHKVVYPPAGVDSAFRRSGFIHPLWSPHGQELTRIQPKDHYHHYGIWNPWTHVLYEGDTVDFWNIGGRKGTVRFAKLLSTTSGPVFSGFEVLHEHVAFQGKEKKEEVALNEVLTVRVYRPVGSHDYYILDFTSKLSCATGSPVQLLEYRYGGLGWRTTGQWDRNNSEVLSSEGKSRKDADGSKAKWCMIQGAVDNDYAGAVMMSHPLNYNHPEPLRIWPENQYDRGDMFANFSPTKDRDWLLKPGETYQLRYRFLVYNGRLDKEKAERAWQDFAAPPQISVKK